MSKQDLVKLRNSWLADWESALGIWSSFTKLAQPRWCLTKEDEKRERLTDSFAMIRLDDHAIVIGLRLVKTLKLEKFSLEILAHEIGHHVYTPADLRDNARLIARTRAALPTREQMTGYICNLYTDILINDRLQRSAELDMAGVYKALKPDISDRLWTLYMRIYEILWSLSPGSLVDNQTDERIQNDATLGARLVRAYSKDWLDGAGRFAALCLPYLLELKKKEVLIPFPWMDADKAGAGAEMPDGLTSIETEEHDGALHPAEDPELTGLGDMFDDGEKEGGEQSSAARAGQRAEKGGKKDEYRTPRAYAELMKSIGVKVSEKDLTIKYYRERAVPRLIRFPTREIREARDPLPEGLEQWESSSPLSELDWTESIVRSPRIIPGITTVQRTYGSTEGSAPEKAPVDLYLGVDCSGSMANPAYDLSYPVLAGTIIVLSALRAGARVKVTLSGEPGEYSSTGDFIRSEKDILKTLTGYLGTGYAYGISRLDEDIINAKKKDRPTHLLIVTDQDIFHMLEETKNGWQMAGQALEIAGGGGTYVLNIHSADYYSKQIARMQNDGWKVHLVDDWESLVAFAQAFSREKYDKETGRPGAGKRETGR